MEKWLKIGKVSALLAPLSFVIFTAIAVINYPGYNIHSNFLSNLGTAENSYIFFIIATTLSGFFAVVLSLALYRIFYRYPLCRAGSITLTFGGIFLIALGIITESQGALHAAISGMFFASMSITFISFGIALRNVIAMAYLFFVAGIIVPMMFYLGITPLLEHVAVALTIMWSMGVGIFMGKK